MPKIERGQFGDLLRRYLGMTGTIDIANELSPEVSPGFTLESERPEWEFLKGARLMGHRVTVGAVAAQPSSVRYRNPLNSGVVAIFTSIVAASDAITTIVLTNGTPQTADLSAVAGTVPRDTRQIIQGGSIIPSSQGTSAGGNAFDQAAVLANTTWRFLTDSPFVLTPGNALNITTGVVNISLFAAAQWLEKRLDQLETQ